MKAMKQCPTCSGTGTEIIRSPNGQEVGAKICTGCSGSGWVPDK